MSITATPSVAHAPAAAAYMRGWTTGATGKPARSPRVHADAYERGYYAGQDARRVAVQRSEIARPAPHEATR